MGAYFKIIRPLNLGIIVLTQLLLRFCIVEVYLGLSGVSPALGYLDFSMLVLATVLVASGGYIVNDIFDLGTDTTNKPQRTLIGKQISIHNAWVYYFAVTFAGVVIGLYLAYRIDYLLLGFIFPAVAGMLYLYSSKYQQTVLMGNIMVALMSGLVVLVPWLFEFFALKTDAIRFVDALKQIPVIQVIVAGYGLFAFLVSLLREIVKDVEDSEGDRENGYRTLVIQRGVDFTRSVTMIIHLLTMGLLAYAMYLLYREGLMLVFWYLLIAVMLLFGYVFYQLSVARVKKDFQFLSNAYKLIMLAGILSMELFYISY